MTLFRLLVSLGFLLVIALFTALIAPYFVDWRVYTRDFEIQTSKILGQPVKVGGDADIRLLPLPTIAFGDLTVGDAGNGEPLMTVDQFSARVELMPFLSGEVRIVEMELERPRFNFDVDEEGRVAWTNRQGIPVDPRQVQLDRLVVRDASFRVTGLFGGQDGEASAITGSGIDAVVSAQSLYGPWRIDGNGEINGDVTEFRVTTGQLSDRGTIRLKITAQQQDHPYELTADGPVSVKDEVLSWNGVFGIVPVPQPPGTERSNQPLPVDIEGAFDLDPNLLEIPEYRMEVGDASDPLMLNGRGRADLREAIHFRLEVDGRQIDLDRIARMREGEGASVTSLEERVRLVRDVVNQIPVPGFNGEIDLEIPAIIAGDTLIREVSALIRPMDAQDNSRGWEVVRAEASLPGNTIVEASGRLGVREAFGFHGKLLLASRQPTGFAAWAAGEVDEAIRGLSRAGLSADVTFTENQTGFDNLELRLDDRVLTGQLRRLGAVEREGRRVANPAILAELSGNLVRLADLVAVSRIVVGDEVVAKNQDLDIRLTAGRFEGFDLEADNLSTQFQYRNGQLTVSRFEAGELLGLKVDGSGQIANLLEQPEGSFSIALNGDDLLTVLPVIQERWFDMPLLRALASDPELTSQTEIMVEIESRAEGEGIRSLISATGTTGGTVLSANAQLGGPFSAYESLRTGASLELSNEDPVLLFRQLGAGLYGFTDLYGGFEGPASASVQVDGNLSDGFETRLALNLSGSSFASEGLISPSTNDGPPAVDLAFTAGTSDVSPFVSAFGYLIPGLSVLEENPVPLSAEGSLSWSGDDGPLMLSMSDGQFGASGFDAELAFRRGEAGRLRAEGTINAERGDLEMFPGLAFGGTELELGGEDLVSGWSDASFAGPVFVGIDGEIELAIARLSVGDGSNATAFKTNLLLSDGAMRLQNARANWFGGTVSGQASLNSTEGTGFGELQFAAEGLAAKSILEAIELPETVDGIAAASGTLEFSGRSAAAMIAGLSGSGTLSLSDSRIEGIRVSGFSELLEQTDGEDFEIVSEAVASIAGDVFLQDHLEAGTLSLPFSVSNGELRVRNLHISNDDGALNAELAIGLSDLSYKAEISLRPDPGLQAIEGASPEVSFTFVSGEGQPAVQSAALEGFLSIRALEAEERRVELLQAAILEKQRLRHDLRTSTLQRNRAEAAVEEEIARREEARRLEEEAARKAAEEEARRRAEEAERQRLAEEAARKAAEEEAKRKAAEEERRRAEEEAERRRAAEEAARKAAEEEAKRKAEQQRLREAEEAARKAAEEAEAQRRAEEAEAREASEIEARPLPAPETPETEPSRSTTTDQQRPVEKTIPSDLFRNLERFLQGN